MSSSQWIVVSPAVVLLQQHGTAPVRIGHWVNCYQQIAHRYSGGNKFVIFCYKLLLNTYYEQVFYFTQNLLILRIPKLSLEVIFDQYLPELSKVWDKVYFKTLFWNQSIVFYLDFLSQMLVKLNFQWQFWNPQNEQILKLSLVLTFDRYL